MLELRGKLPEIYLLPGELHLAREPAVIRTILGSCVGITFWSATLGIGALCHSLLPRRPGSSPAGVKREQGHRYVDFAIRDLAQQFDRLGARREDVQVKLFGGADVLAVKNHAKPTIGRLNCEAAIEIVKAEGFVVAASSLGGNAGLNIRFNTRTGEVLLRRLAPVVFEDVMDEYDEL